MSTILIAICILISSMTFLNSRSHLSFIALIILKQVDTFSIHIIVLPLSPIYLSFWKFINSISLSLSSVNLSLVDTTIIVFDLFVDSIG